MRATRATRRAAAGAGTPIGQGKEDLQSETYFRVISGAKY